MTVHVNLPTLDPREFMRIMPTRVGIINAAPDTPLPESFPMGDLAAALHPQTQFFTISEVVAHGADAKSYTLVPDESMGTKAPAYFAAGQYLPVVLEIDGARLRKPYSIRSSPREALEDRYVLTIKRTEGGFASPYILDNWKVGSRVETGGPEGAFTYEPLRDAPHILGIAGGSGVTPFHSLARAICEGTEDASLTLLYGSRKHCDILLREEMEAIAAACDKIKVVHVLSEDSAPNCEGGFITADIIQKYAPAGEYSVFLCGPQAMYAFVDREIEKLGILRVRHELFGEVHAPEALPGYPAGMSGKTFSLQIKLFARDVEIAARSGETLLVAMERAGIAAPSKCRSGECGFCHSRLISGEIFIPAGMDKRRQADAKFGFIHPCCTYPLGDLYLEVPAE